MVAVLLLLLAASTPGAPGVASPPQGGNDFVTGIAAIEARVSGRMGVAALDTGSGKRFDYRSQERFPMCSSLNFLLPRRS